MAAPAPGTNGINTPNEAVIIEDGPPVLDMMISKGRGRGRNNPVESIQPGKRETRSNSMEADTRQQIAAISSVVNSQKASIMQLTDAVSLITDRLGHLKSPSRACHEFHDSDIEEYDTDEEVDPISTLTDGLYTDNTPNGETGVESELGSTIDSLLNATEEPPEYAAPLPDQVAVSFNRLPQKEIKPEILKKFKDLYQVPENAKLLGAPRVNPEIWARLHPSTRTKDGQLQYTQLLLSQSMVAHARMAASIRQAVQDNPSCMPKELTNSIFNYIMDSATCIGAAQRDINVKRRAEMKPRLGDLAPLCSSRIPITELLFGDNIEQDMKTARSTSRGAQPSGNYSTNKRSYSDRSYSSGRGSEGYNSFKKPRFSQTLNWGRGQRKYPPSGSRQLSSRPQQTRKFHQERMK